MRYPYWLMSWARLSGNVAEERLQEASASFHPQTIIVGKINSYYIINERAHYIFLKGDVWDKLMVIDTETQRGHSRTNVMCSHQT